MARAVGQVLALTGGVGGAKLALGLDRMLSAGDLHALVNVGDDFRHLGLHISPDIDTLLYTLSGLAHKQQGWGLQGETFRALEALERLGADTWFKLGDADLATHLWRTHALAEGVDLLQVTRDLAQRLGIHTHVHPMSADPVHTMVHSGEQSYTFQSYFVREQCAPEVTRFSFSGIEKARPNPHIMTMLEADSFSHIVICPSNPYVSIDPILQLPGLWQRLRDTSAEVILVSPIVGGQALKGPAAKMMAELGAPVSAAGVAAHYAQRYPALVEHFVIDTEDATLADAIEKLDMHAVVLPTVLRTLQDKQDLAGSLLSL